MAYRQVGSDILGEFARDFFGYSVSMSADGMSFVVGAPLNNRNGIGAGHVRVYRFNTSVNAYTQLGSDIDGEAASDSFGTSVSMSSNGTIVIVGAPLHDGSSGTNAGRVRAYQWNETAKEYRPLIESYVDGIAEGDQFGYSVSMSSDGSKWVIGARYSDGGGNVDAGQVRVFQPQSATLSPTKAPTKTPTKAPTKQPTKTPTKVPTKTPSSNIAPSAVTSKPVNNLPSPPTSCGLLRLNFFCPQRGKCGFFRRLWNLHGCE
jgi:hypothetical protein